VRDNGLRPLPEEARTIAEIAREGGCETAAFVAAAVLEGAWGLAQGFDVYDQPAGSSVALTAHIEERSSIEIVDAARSWLLGRDRSKPFFLWVHLFDPHAPYEPSERFLQQAGGIPYLGEVAAMDHAVGDLLDALATDPAWPRTTVVVVADHGESLGQHGEATHSILCYRPTIRVPLIVRHADGTRAGERTGEPASVVDVCPTIAEALGRQIPEGLDGASLLRARLSDDRVAYFESYVGYLNHGWSPIVGCADGRGKLLASPGIELFAPEGDPYEKRDLAPSRPGDVERYRARLLEIVRRPALRHDNAGVADEATLARIRALGYAGAGDPEAVLPEPLTETGRPGPRDRLGELDDYYAALLDANAGRSQEAISKLQAITRANPGNVAALDALGKLLVDAGRMREAVPVLQGLLEIGPRRVSTHQGLGRCFEAMHELERALEQYLAAAKLKPHGEREALDAARVLDALGRDEEASAWRARGGAGR
jgi:tetratricopeptide (TPR) repeat protein